MNVVPNCPEERPGSTIHSADREPHVELHKLLLFCPDSLKDKTRTDERLRRLVHVHAAHTYVLHLEREQRVPVPSVSRVRVVLAQHVPVLHDEAGIFQNDVPNLAEEAEGRLLLCRGDRASVDVELVDLLRPREERRLGRRLREPVDGLEDARVGNSVALVAVGLPLPVHHEAVPAVHRIVQV